MNSGIYADNASTTRIPTPVLEAMMPYLTDYFGNPSSKHKMGVIAHSAISESRKNLASILSCNADEIIFTSGGTEAANAAIIGTIMSTDKRHLITSKIEHPAVLNTCRILERFGYSISYIGVDKSGQVNISEIEKSVSKDTALIAIMYANNETGVVQPITEIASIANNEGIPFFSDATQAIGQIDIDLSSTAIDLLGFSGHKFGAPKGIGVLFRRNHVNIFPMINGGGQENNYRSGTENVAGIVGLSAALLESKKDFQQWERVKMLRNELYERLMTIPHTYSSGDLPLMLPGFISICFEFCNGYDLVDYLNQYDIYISASSACASKNGEPSYVLQAMGIPYSIARGAIRISLSKNTTSEDTERILAVLSEGVEKLRKSNPEYRKRCL